MAAVSGEKVTRNPKALEAATLLGRRAGRSFVDTGIWPRCPFRDDDVADLSLAWCHGCFEVTQTVTRPPEGYWAWSTETSDAG